jgi:hypothetical protein
LRVLEGSNDIPVEKRLNIDEVCDKSSEAVS